MSDGTNFVQCRTLGHAWREVDDEADHTSSWFSGANRPNAVVLPVVLPLISLHVECQRCGMLRTDVLHGVTGELRSRRYKYPSGYLYSKGTPCPPRSTFRLQLLAYRKAAKEGKNP